MSILALNIDTFPEDPSNIVLTPDITLQRTDEGDYLMTDDLMQTRTSFPGRKNFGVSPPLLKISILDDMIFYDYWTRKLIGRRKVKSQQREFWSPMGWLYYDTSDGTATFRGKQIRCSLPTIWTGKYVVTGDKKVYDSKTGDHISTLPIKQNSSLDKYQCVAINSDTLMVSYNSDILESGDWSYRANEIVTRVSASEPAQELGMPYQPGSKSKSFEEYRRITAWLDKLKDYESNV